MIRKVLFGLLALLAIVALAFIFWPEKKYVPYQVPEAYQKQVDAFFVPPMPDDWVWKSYPTSDGTKLRWGETGNRDAAKATIIWVPGYTAHLNMYGEHIDMLARRGFHVIGVDLRGQGGSDRHWADQPEKLWVEDFSVYSDDLAAFMADLNLPSDRRVILNGISFGGHVATRTIRDHKPDIDGLYLIAPAFQPTSGEYTAEEALKLMNWGRRLGKAKHYMPGEGDWRPDGEDLTRKTDCSSYPQRLYYRDVLFTRHPELRVGGVTHQWGAEFFESSETLLAPGYLEAIDIPVTIISAALDTFVVTAVNSQACQSVLPNCREVAIPETGHCLPQESDAVVEQMMDEFDGLLERVISGSN